MFFILHKQNIMIDAHPSQIENRVERGFLAAFVDHYDDNLLLEAAHASKLFEHFFIFEITAAEHLQFPG